MTRPRPIGLLRLEDRLAPATWDGGGANNSWTTAANWVVDVAPNPGDDLVFPAGGAQQVNVNNLAPGTTFHSLNITGGGYSLGGNGVNLTVGASADLPSFEISTVGLVIGGSGGLSKVGGGTLILSGANTYVGMTTVASGYLEVQSSAALGAIGTGNGTTVASGATLQFRGGTLTVPEPIAFGGLGVDPDGFSTEGALKFLGGVVTLSGALTLTSNAYIKARANGSFDRFIVTAGIGETGGSFGLQLNVVPLIVFAPTSVNSYTGPTEMVGGTAEFDGQSVGNLIADAGVIAGTGTVGDVPQGLFVMPGRFDAQSQLTPGTLTVGNLDLSIGRFLLATGSNSKLVVHGAVRINISITPLTNGTAHLHPGDVYTVIDNDSVDPVVLGAGAPPEGAIVAAEGAEARLSYHGGDGNDVTLTVVSRAASAVGAGAGGLPVVNVYNGVGDLVRSFFAYDTAFRGGVRVATADLNGDGNVEIITAPGAGGGPVVRIWDGATGAMIRQFNAYDPNFRGGVFVAAARIDTGDDVPDIITGAGKGGGPHVRVFNGANGQVISEWLAYDPHFTGGVSVAGVDVSPFDHTPGQVITGAGAGGGPHVRIFTGTTGAPVSEFLAYDPNFTGGVNVAAGFANGGIVNDHTVVTAPGAGAPPEVRVFSFEGQQQASFMAYNAAFRGGVTVAVWKPARSGNVQNPSGLAEILTGPGPGGGPHVEQWQFLTMTPTIHRSYFAFDPAFLGGIYVG